jgi:hypothetical protein
MSQAAGRELRRAAKPMVRLSSLRWGPLGGNAAEPIELLHKDGFDLCDTAMRSLEVQLRSTNFVVSDRGKSLLTYLFCRSGGRLKRFDGPLVVQMPARPHATEGIDHTASDCVPGHPSESSVTLLAALASQMRVEIAGGRP